MSKNYTIEAQARETAGKGAARALRREGRVPAVIYGGDKSPVTISCPSKEITLEYHKGHMFTTLCDVEVGKDKHLVLARDIQLHPVNDTIEHVDFLRVTAKTRLNVMVPVQLVNEEDSPGMQQKGVLNVVRHEIEVSCLATAIPDAIDVDMAGTEHGDAIKVSSAKLPEGVRPVIDDRDFTIAVLNAPKTVEEEETEGDEDAGETAEAADGDAEGDSEE